MSQSEQLEIEVVVGEDFTAQIYWTDEDSKPMIATTPARLEVRDQADVLVLQFASENYVNAATKAALTITGSDGVIQLSAPRTVTDDLIPGRYLFDLFAISPGGVAPFPSQQVQVVNGWFIVSPRTTRSEVAPI